jgi:hypothetical protein
LLSVTVPKFLWLGVTVLAFYACARRLLREPAHARMATLWLAGIYYISWECVQNYSHSVQVLAVSMLCVWQVLRMRRARSLGAYAVFGALCALGLLSKFNFAVLMAALLMASARVPTYRALLLDRRLALSIAVCLILLAPVLWAQWSLLSTQMVATQHKFAIAPAWSAGLALSGALSAAKGLASWLSPLLVFVVLGMPRAVVGAAPQAPVPTPDGGDLVEDERWRPGRAVAAAGPAEEAAQERRFHPSCPTSSVPCPPRCPCPRPRRPRRGCALRRRWPRRPSSG